jgi:hypothetical protein
MIYSACNKTPINWGVRPQNVGGLAKSELLASCRGYAEAVAALTAVARECIHGTRTNFCLWSHTSVRYR